MHGYALTVEKSPSLRMSAVSSTIWAHDSILGEERHFALLVGLRFSNLGSLFNRSGQQLSPTQPSLRSQTAIMITCSNSPLLRGAGYPIITSVIYSPPRRFPGSPACEPNFSKCA